MCYTEYGVPGIREKAVRDHLSRLTELLQTFVPEAELEVLCVV